MKKSRRAGFSEEKKIWHADDKGQGKVTVLKPILTHNHTGVTCAAQGRIQFIFALCFIFLLKSVNVQRRRCPSVFFWLSNTHFEVQRKHASRGLHLVRYRGILKSKVVMLAATQRNPSPSFKINPLSFFILCFGLFFLNIHVPQHGQVYNHLLHNKNMNKQRKDNYI